MLKRVDKQYLMDCGYQLFKAKNREKLICNYPFVQIFGQDMELIELMSVEIVLGEENNQWSIEKCYTELEQTDVFDLFFRDRTMKSLIEFHRRNSIEL